MLFTDEEAASMLDTPEYTREYRVFFGLRALRVLQYWRLEYSEHKQYPQYRDLKYLQYSEYLECWTPKYFSIRVNTSSNTPTGSISLAVPNPHTLHHENISRFYTARYCGLEHYFGAFNSNAELFRGSVLWILGVPQVYFSMFSYCGYCLYSMVCTAHFPSTPSIWAFSIARTPSTPSI